MFSVFGRTSSYVQKIPYDHAMRDEIGLRTPRSFTFLNVIFAALIEILCLFRLFASLLGHASLLGRGWDAFSEPTRLLLEPMLTFLHSANF